MSVSVSLLVVFGLIQLESESFLDVSAVLQLQSVVEGGGVVLRCLRAHALGDVVRCEGVNCEESCELSAIAGSAEDILVEDEVGSEEDEHRLKVDDGRVGGAGHDPRLFGFHYFNF